jgi:hypothetical protein
MGYLYSLLSVFPAHASLAWHLFSLLFFSLMLFGMEIFFRSPHSLFGKDEEFGERERERFITQVM